MDDLIPRVGSVDRSSALKALETWVDLGVLKEDVENSFRLLEIAEEATPGARAGAVRQGGCSLYLHAVAALNLPHYIVAAEEPPPVVSVQQQQAEQMRVYWKVRWSVCSPSFSANRYYHSLSRACSQTLGSSVWTASKACSNSHQDTIGRWTSWVRSWKQLEWRGWSQ